MSSWYVLFKNLLTLNIEIYFMTISRVKYIIDSCKIKIFKDTSQKKILTNLNFEFIFWETFFIIFQNKNYSKKLSKNKNYAHNVPEYNHLFDLNFVLKYKLFLLFFKLLDTFIISFLNKSQINILKCLQILSPSQNKWTICSFHTY